MDHLCIVIMWGEKIPTFFKQILLQKWNSLLSHVITNVALEQSVLAYMKNALIIFLSFQDNKKGIQFENRAVFLEGTMGMILLLLTSVILFLLTSRAMIFYYYFLTTCFEAAWFAALRSLARLQKSKYLFKLSSGLWHVSICILSIFDNFLYVFLANCYFFCSAFSVSKFEALFFCQVHKLCWPSNYSSHQPVQNNLWYKTELTYILCAW